MANQTQTSESLDWVRRLQEKGVRVRPATRTTGFPPRADRREATPLIAFWRRTLRRLRHASLP